MPRFPNFQVLRKRRRVMDITLDEVARALGCSKSLLSDYERGWQPKTGKARERWRNLSVKYARLLDEFERKSKGGRSRSKEVSDAKAW